MDNLTGITETIHLDFEARTKARDQAVMQARQITRQAANTIRAIHRGEVEPARENLQRAREMVNSVKQVLTGYPDLYFAGYTQDAIKEFVEASVTCALLLDQPLPTPQELEVESSTFMNGLAEVPGELRRRCMDILRHGYSQEAERLLTCMDDIYAVLVTMDYPDAITNGLRRQTDLVRGILERTRSDITLSYREEQLKQTMNNFVEKLVPPRV
jgi:translin